MNHLAKMFLPSKDRLLHNAKTMNQLLRGVLKKETNQALIGWELFYCVVVLPNVKYMV